MLELAEDEQEYFIDKLKKKTLIGKKARNIRFYSHYRNARNRKVNTGCKNAKYSRDFRG